METEYLKEFIKLAELKSFSKAAESLYINQSMLSKHMQKLEAEVGADLIRRTYPLELTRAGQYFYEKACVLSNEISEMKEKAQSIQSGYSGTLRIGLCNNTTLSPAKDIRMFQRANPTIEIKTRTMDPTILIDMITENKMDIVNVHMIYGSEQKYTQHFNSMPSNSGKMCIFVNAYDDFFRGKNSISIKDLNEKVWVCIDTPFYRHEMDMIVEKARKHGAIIPRIVYVPTVYDALLYVRLYDNISFHPADTTIGSGTLKLLTISEPDFLFTRYYLWSENNDNPSIVKFIERTTLSE